MIWILVSSCLVCCQQTDLWEIRSWSIGAALLLAIFSQLYQMFCWLLWWVGSIYQISVIIKDVKQLHTLCLWVDLNLMLIWMKWNLWIKCSNKKSKEIDVSLIVKSYCDKIYKIYFSLEITNRPVGHFEGMIFKFSLVCCQILSSHTAGQPLS